MLTLAMTPTATKLLLLLPLLELRICKHRAPPRLARLPTTQMENWQPGTPAGLAACSRLPGNTRLNHPVIAAEVVLLQHMACGAISQSPPKH